MAKKRIMLDLETVDTKPSAAILSIGAVSFSEDGVGDWKFYNACELDEQLQLGRTYSEKTMQWWSEQSAEARAVFNDPKAVPLVTALHRFAEFCTVVCEYAGSKELEMWANGPDFDCVLLADAYRWADMEQPWRFGGHRCYRTLKNLEIKLGPGEGTSREEGTHHNALDDAIYQATYAAAWLRALK
jgi:hypothetical protein